MTVHRLHPDDIRSIAIAVVDEIHSRRASEADASRGERTLCEKDENVSTDHIDEEVASESTSTEAMAIESLTRLRQKPRPSPSSTLHGARSSAGRSRPPSR